jgi:hypothetical protein
MSTKQIHIVERGMRFGRLTVIMQTKMNDRLAAVCRCDCGDMITRRVENLAGGKSRSCGCLRRENAMALFKKVRQPYTKISDQAVEEIRSAPPGTPQKALAADHGITQAHVSLIRLGKTRARKAP